MLFFWIDVSHFAHHLQTYGVDQALFLVFLSIYVFPHSLVNFATFINVWIYKTYP